MVYQAIIGFLGSSLLTSDGDNGGLNKWFQNALLFLGIALVAFILLMSVNAYCFFASSCTNWVDVLLPDWFQEYFGIMTTATPRRQTLLGRFAVSGFAGVGIWALERYALNRARNV